MMSVHDALEAWQSGEITSRRAMDLTGVSNLVELYGLAQACDVEIKLELSDDEKRTVEAAGAAIERAFARENAEPSEGMKFA
jgi:hypothetical protein